MIESGVKLEKTEHIAHYLKSADIAKKMSEGVMKYGKAFEETDEYKKLEEEMNESDAKRELFIKKSIEKTLKDCETGILFLGNDHDIEFSDDINVIPLFDKEKLKEETA